MSKSIALLLSKTGGPPFHGSVGYVNDAIAPILARRGWDTRAFAPPRGQGQEALLPLTLASQLAALDGDARPDVALYDAAATSVVRAPSRGTARRNAMLYHGLAYGAGSWMGSADVDLHLANSPYLARVLRAFFAFPNWQRRECLNPAGLQAVVDLPLPLPCVEEPDGHPGFTIGAELPAHVRRALDGDVIWGHALQPGKNDWFATLAILVWLDMLRGAARLPRIALLIPQGALGRELRAALDGMLPPGRSCDDYFLEVPLLRQCALFEVMRACRFGLAYGPVPESFGFYALESVHNGCPFHTNGAGNLRFLLPAGHGLRVHENFDMVPGPQGEQDPSAYRAVAERILSDLARPQAVADECARGAALIRERHSLDAFGRALGDALDTLDSPRPAPPTFDDMHVQLSPLVRAMDPATGGVHCDYASTTLAPDALAALRQLVGQPCSALDGRDMHALESSHRLFARGLLSLAPAGAVAGPASALA